MPKVLKEKITGLERLAPSIFRMTLASEYVVQNAMPGQFINIKCSEGINAMLRRPISICSVNRENNTFDFVFQIKGIGTEYLSQKQIGSELDIIAPLGNSFTVPESVNKIAVVGGGIGIFPLYYLLKENKHLTSAAYLGFRNKDFVVMEEDFKAACGSLHLCTDDGSKGYGGMVTDPLEEDMAAGKYDMVFSCGPTPMLQKVAALAEKYSVKCQVSMEQRMGCGIGACLVCACKTKLGDDWEYSHVCKDGPVFWSDEVIFD